MTRRADPALSIVVRDRQARARIDRRAARGIVAAVCAGEAPAKAGEITACFIDDRAIRRLNARFHATDSPTDVLAFDMGDAREFLADIIVSTDTAAANARRFGTSLLFECYLYLIHGALHLTGYDDTTPRARSLMRKMERRYLKQLKIG